MRKISSFINNHKKTVIVLWTITAPWILLSVILNLSFVQTKVAKYYADYLSEKLKNKITIEKVSISVFDGLTAERIYFEDDKTDTLAYIKKISVIPLNINFTPVELDFYNTKIDSLIYFLKIDKAGNTNLQFIIDYFASESKSTEKKSYFLLKCRNFELTNSKFVLKKELSDTVNFGLNYTDLNVSEINAYLQNFELRNADIQTEIKNISFKEKSGLRVDTFATENTVVTSKNIINKNLVYKTPDTRLDCDSLNLIYENWLVFSDFVNAVKLEISVKKDSHIAVKDIAYFAPMLSDYNSEFGFSGEIYGTVNNLKTNNLTLLYGKNTQLVLNSETKNITYPDSLNFDINIKKFETSINDISSIKIKNDTVNVFEIPDELKNIKILKYSGNIAGNLEKFSSKGKITSAGGVIFSEILGIKTEENKIEITSSLNTSNFLPNKIISLPTVRYITVSNISKIKISNENKLFFENESIIDSLEFKTRKYTNIGTYIKGVDKKIDSLNLYINTEGLNFRAFGEIDFSNKLPSGKIKAELEKADFNSLKLVSDSSKQELSLFLDIIFSGNSATNFTGEISLTKPLIYKKDSLKFTLENFELTSKKEEFNDSISEISIKSDYLDASISGIFNIEEIIGSANVMLHSFAPTLSSKSSEYFSGAEVGKNKGYFSVNIDLKNTERITGLFAPEIEIAGRTTLTGYFNSSQNQLDFSVTGEEFTNNELIINDPFLLCYTVSDSLIINTGCTNFIYNDYLIENPDFNAGLKNDSVEFGLTWDNRVDSLRNKGDLSGLLTFSSKENLKNSSYKIYFNNSDFIIKDSLWQLEKSVIELDTTSVKFNNFSLYNGEQKILIEGNVSEYEGDFLQLDFTDFRLENLNLFFDNGFKIEGKLTGNSRIINAYNKPMIFTDNSVKSLMINEISLGDMYLKSNWVDSSSYISINVSTEAGRRRKIKTTQITGHYSPKTDSISLDISIIDFRPKKFKSYFDDYISFKRGTNIIGNANVSGTLKSPKIFGEISLRQTNFKVKYTNTRYNINGIMKLSFDNNEINITETKLIPEQGRGFALLSGKIKHSNFSNFISDIDIKTDNFRILNTQADDTSYFYGQAYISGDINVKSSETDTKITALTVTENGTKIFIPLTSGTSLSEENGFMSFVKTEKTGKHKRKSKTVAEENTLYGFSLNVGVELTPGAEIQLIMDQMSGDIIKAKGRGNIDLIMDNTDEIKMFGDYTILKGDYLFTMKNVFSKKFEIEKGGVIMWKGDPYNALIDMNAIYKLRKVSVYDFLPELQYREIKTRVNCELKMTETLLKPHIEFGVTMPYVNEQISQHLKNLPEDEISKQLLSLLILNRFQPLPGLSRDDNQGSSPINTSEVLTNQLNHWLSQISEDVDVGVNYNTGDNITSDEVELALSTQIWDERLTINGNVGVGGGLRTGQEQTGTNSIVGDVEVEIKLNKKGSLKMKAYNKSNDVTAYDEAPYTQGIAIFLRKEFNAVLFRRKKKVEDFEFKH